METSSRCYVKSFDLSCAVFMMFSSSANWLLLNLITVAFSLSLNAPNATETYISQNATPEKILNSTTNARPYCTLAHGGNMPRDSCRAALSKIERNTERKNYRPRHRTNRPPPQSEVPLPIRYLSDDGICAIDILLAPVC